MTLKSTVLFGKPQSSIFHLIETCIRAAISVRIVTGFATPEGVRLVEVALAGSQNKLETLIVGAATLPAFNAFDKLITSGVSPGRLFIHLGHSAPSGGRKNPFIRHHPMLHSKIYYMEMPNGQACAFIGSHNLTKFALGGLNGEAAVMLEGPATDPEFSKIRDHINEARSQAQIYDANLKDAYAWWLREYLDGIRYDVGSSQDWSSTRTVLIFAELSGRIAPKTGDTFYFELPNGIDEISNLKAEVHLFLFTNIPRTPLDAFQKRNSASLRFSGRILGAENRQGNLEITADWRLDTNGVTTLEKVPRGKHKPSTLAGMQQVRAEIKSEIREDFDYQFERKGMSWEPILSDSPSDILIEFASFSISESSARKEELVQWKLVSGIRSKQDTIFERDYLALSKVTAEAGSYVQISLQRRLCEKK